MEQSCKFKNVAKKDEAEKKEWTNENPVIKFDANLNIEKDYFVGAALEHDTVTLKDSSVAFVKKEDSNKYWLSYNINKSVVKAGCFIHYADKNFTHVYEAKFDHSEKAKKEFQDQALRLAAGGKYVLSKASSMTYGVEVGKHSNMQAKWEHKLDSNWKVTANQSFDNNRLETKQAPYDLGFDIAYTL